MVGEDSHCQRGDRAKSRESQNPKAPRISSKRFKWFWQSAAVPNALGEGSIGLVSLVV